MLTARDRMEDKITGLDAGADDSQIILTTSAGLFHSKILAMRVGFAERLLVTHIGIGIASADLPHIFDRFYRVQVDRSRATGGTGLGLAIVQAIGQSYQGTIQVSSELDNGSVFTVRLPAKISPAKPSVLSGGLKY